jgi:DNA (cytosine-5)-methyltransferase 1
VKFGSLFSGIGGIDLGLERAGMRCVWQVEIDDYCTRVLEKHWPDVERFGNVKEVGKENLAPIDLIAGGFPCQPHSVAGKRRGAEDDRNLWPEFIRVIRELKPGYVLAENVPGIITTYIDTVLSDLESEGYTCATFNLPAVAFNAPHRRERIFIVGYASSSRRSDWGGGDAEIHMERDALAAPGRNQSEHAPDRPSANVAYAQSIRTGQQCHHEDNRKHQESKRELGGAGLREGRESFSQWTTEPNVGRVAHGIPSRVDRLRGLGNAVVPQVAEWAGRRILEHDE